MFSGSTKKASAFNFVASLVLPAPVVLFQSFVRCGRSIGMTLGLEPNYHVERGAGIE